jgi:hypothetical protein
MISFNRTNQGGAIRTYIVIGVLLAVVTIGVARFVQQHGQQVRQNQAIALADNQVKAKNANTAINDTAVTIPAGNSNGSNATSGNDNSTQAATTSPQTGQSSSELPTTGPESGVMQIIFSALMTGSLVAYFGSRKVARVSL